MAARANVALDRTFAALADPTRRMLIDRIGRKPHRAGDLCRGSKGDPLCMTRAILP